MQKMNIKQQDINKEPSHNILCTRRDIQLVEQIWYFWSILILILVPFLSLFSISTFRVPLFRLLVPILVSFNNNLNKLRYFRGIITVKINQNGYQNINRDRSNVPIEDKHQKGTQTRIWVLKRYQPLVKQKKRCKLYDMT